MKLWTYINKSKFQNEIKMNIKCHKLEVTRGILINLELARYLILKSFQSIIN